MSTTPTPTNAAPAQTPPARNAPKKKGVVKCVLSGDTVIIRGPLKNGPPPEKQITFSNIIAPKLAKRPTQSGEETRDEPYAWDAREYLRKRLIGEEVFFTHEPLPSSKREYGVVYLGKDQATAENIVDSIVSEGLVSVRKEGNRSPEVLRLLELEDKAKAEGKGKWSNNASPNDNVRNIQWTQENPRQIVDNYAGKPVKAVIEHVRDGSTIRAFLIPDFYHITMMISGIRCPGVKLDNNGKPDTSVVVPFADEAKYFVESRLLQRDVEIRLESVNNSNFVGSILYPKGNIAEALLREGFAKCVDWSMVFMKTGADKLRAAEKQAKEKRLRLWKDYQSNAQQFTGKEKDFNGIVVEVLNGDALNVKLPSGQVKKVFFSSIRPPSKAGRATEEEGKAPQRTKFRPLYDVPWMFECREFLRKKMIGKKVHCNLDYISPARDSFPEKCCYTVNFGGQNMAEQMVLKGYATVIRYRQDDDQRSSRYDELLAAEAQAIKNGKGVHAKKDIPTHRVNDLTTDHSRIKQQYLPSWQRAVRNEAIVEFVASGSRIRLYIPKDSCLVTFLLAGISCPKSSRPALNGAPGQDGQPYGDEALAFTRDRILQQDVSVHVETTDKAGASVIGWLWTDQNVNLSVALVEEGLAQVHFSAEKSDFHRMLLGAETRAKAAKKNIWSNYVEEVIIEEKHDDEKDDKTVDRKLNYESVIVTAVTPELRFFVQRTDEGTKLENLMTKLRQEFQMSPPITGSYRPKHGDLCAAKFTDDNEWYRAKVEKVQGDKATVCYVDYGNKEDIPLIRLAMLPHAFTSEKSYATEYSLALTDLPPDKEDKDEAFKEFYYQAINGNEMLLNIEYRTGGAVSAATLHDPNKNKLDVGKNLIETGYLLVEKRRDRKLKILADDYKKSQQKAKESRSRIWEYGDITQDDNAEYDR